MSYAWKRCPRCGSRAMVEVLYGSAEDPSLRDLWVLGKAMLRRVPEGGCVPPGWECRECGFQVRARGPADTGPSASVS